MSLGWPRTAVRVIDDDLGRSGASTAGRSGFADLAAQVGLGHVGIVLSLECSRLARNNADWYRLLDLAGTCDTLIGDADGVYHPGLFNDRLVRHEAPGNRVEVRDLHRRAVAAAR